MHFCLKKNGVDCVWRLDVGEINQDANKALFPACGSPFRLEMAAFVLPSSFTCVYTGACQRASSNRPVWDLTHTLPRDINPHTTPHTHTQNDQIEKKKTPPTRNWKWWCCVLGPSTTVHVYICMFDCKMVSIKDSRDLQGYQLAKQDILIRTVTGLRKTGHPEISWA